MRVPRPQPEGAALPMSTALATPRGALGARRDLAHGWRAAMGPHERQSKRRNTRLREHPLDEVGCGGAHASTEARRAESAALAAKCDEPALVARAAPKPREAAAEQAAVEVRLKLLRRVLRQFDVERAIGDGAVERLEVVAHELVERR